MKRKTCAECCESLPLSHFSIDRSQSQGRHRICRRCNHEEYLTQTEQAAIAAAGWLHEAGSERMDVFEDREELDDTCRLPIMFRMTT